MLVLVFVIFSFVVFVSYVQTRTNSELISTKNKTICSQYGNIEGVENELREKYVVKKGDTLIGIASGILNNPSAISDLILINNNLYPSLLEKGLLEVGWVLYLPNNDLKAKNYSMVWKAMGNILFLDNGKFLLTAQTKGDYVIGAMQVSESMGREIKENVISSGDCVVVYLGKGSGFVSEVYTVKRQ